MRKGIVVTVTAADRARLEAVVADRNSPQKHVWRARIILLTADSLGTNAIMRGSGRGKSVVWPWQERFMQEGVGGPSSTLAKKPTRPLAATSTGSTIPSGAIPHSTSQVRLNSKNQPPNDLTPLHHSGASPKSAHMVVGA